MKKQFSVILLILLVSQVLILSGCAKKEENLSDLWQNADYIKDTEIGVGSKMVQVEVTIGEKTIVLTVHTDRTILGDALTDYGIVAGDAGPFGLYIKYVIGVQADYSVNQTYWSFYIDGELAMSGVDLTDISEGSVYQLVYTK